MAQDRHDRSGIERRLRGVYEACLAPAPKVIFCEDRRSYAMRKSAFLNERPAWRFAVLLAFNAVLFHVLRHVITIDGTAVAGSLAFVPLASSASALALYGWFLLLRSRALGGDRPPWRLLLIPGDLPPCALARPLLSALRSVHGEAAAGMDPVLGRRAGFELEAPGAGEGADPARPSLRSALAGEGEALGPYPEVLRRLREVAEAVPAAVLMDDFALLLLEDDPEWAAAAPEAPALTAPRRRAIRRALEQGPEAVARLARRIAGIPDPGRGPLGRARGWPVEAREAALRALGLDRVVEALGIAPARQDECGRLYRIGGRRFANLFVRVEDRVRDEHGQPLVHWIAVPPHISTPREGVAWSFGLAEGEYAPTAQS